MVRWYVIDDVPSNVLDI